MLFHLLAFFEIKETSIIVSQGVLSLHFYLSPVLKMYDSHRKIDYLTINQLIKTEYLILITRVMVTYWSKL